MTESLREQVRALEGDVDRLDALVAGLRAENAALRRGLLASTGDDLAALESATGSRPATGPGVRVTLDDAPGKSADPLTGEPRAADGHDLGRVLDRDIQQVVNALWAAGAEAVAVSGQRLTATSAIRAAGAAILVDYRPVSPPYVIAAIGDPRSLQADFVASPTAAAMETLASATGIRFDVEGAGSLHLPGAPGLSLRHARPAGRS